jgi:hypothetical protein
MRVRFFVIVLLLIVANAKAFGSGISYTRRLNSFQRSIKKHRNSDDVEVSEVLTSTATATATPSAMPSEQQQPEVKAPAGETTVLIGLGFLFLATFRMMIVGF